MRILAIIISVGLLIGCEQKVKASKRNDNKNLTVQKDSAVISGDNVSVSDSSVEPIDTALALKKSSRKRSVDFELVGLDGMKYKLSEHIGKVIFVSFWAPWCSPCRAEIPVLKEIYDKYKDKDFLIFGVGLDKEKALRDFASKNGINYPVLIGTEKVAQSYEVNGIPATFVLDKKGNIAGSHVGFGGKETKKELEIELKKLLKE